MMPPDSDLPTDIDYALIESTYGLREHDDKENTKSKLEELVQKTIQNNGKLIIPAFSLQRTPQIIFDLYLTDEKIDILDDFIIYVDSPSGYDGIVKYKKNGAYFPKDIFPKFLESVDPKHFKNLHFVKSAQESRELAEKPGPFAVIGSHGMLAGGRVLKHYKAGVEQENTIIAITGFQAPGTPGYDLVQRKLINNEKTIDIEGKTYNLNAEVVRLRGYSGHADCSELMDHFGKIADPDRLQGTFVVHGDLENSNAIANLLRQRNYQNVIVPVERKKYVLS